MLPVKWMPPEGEFDARVFMANYLFLSNPPGIGSFRIRGLLSMRTNGQKPPRIRPEDRTAS